MSNPSTTPAQPSSRQPDPPIGSDNRRFTAKNPDPLLRNGYFVGPTNNRPTGIRPENGPPPPSSVNAEAQPLRARRKVSDDTSWLPPGWVIEDRVRTNGATAGLVDKYYIEPITNRRFRSKKEVQYYLETGTKKEPGSRKRKTENPEANPPSENPENHKKKSSTSTESSAPNFDSLNVPERVAWVLTDVKDDAEGWTAFAGDTMVPEFDKQKWDLAFSSITSKHQGKMMF